MKLRVLPAVLLSATALLLSGCIAGLTYSPGGPGYIFVDGNVIQAHVLTPHTTLPMATTVLGYSLDSTGTPAPAITLSAPTGSFVAIGVDRNSNIYALNVPNGSAAQIEVFNPNASTPSTPVRLITLPTINGAIPFAFAVDLSGNSYVAYNDNAGTLIKYGPTAADNGSTPATPALTLTGIVSSFLMCTDSNGNLYDVQDLNLGNGLAEVINVYNAGFTTSTPSRTINPNPNPNVNNISFNGITIGASGDIYTTAIVFPGFIEEIAIFSTTATSAPTTVIAGQDTTLRGPTGIAVDSQGTIYVRDSTISPAVVTGPVANSPQSTPAIVDTFSFSASGDAAPVSSFTTTLTGRGNGLAIH